MTRKHECECNVEGCECREVIACTPGADWCEHCDEGCHVGARFRPCRGVPVRAEPGSLAGRILGL